jgi:hypothetical protein
MNTTSMTERIREAPRPKARIAGLIYLLNFLTGVVAVPGFKLVVSGNATATAANILAHQLLFRLGFAALLLNVAIYVVVTALFYDLFKPVDRSLSLLAAFFSLVGCAVQALACLFYLAPVVVLGGGQYLSVFKVEQLRALALMFFELYGQAYNIGLVFFGFYCLLIGYLVFRSTFMPRILGVMMALAGLAWLTFMLPPLANYLIPYNLAVGALMELSLTLWLLAMGVKVERWRESGASV